MDFHAFKRSKALQSPVCLVGWNSEGTAEQPEAAELWLSLSWAWICPHRQRHRLERGLSTDQSWNVPRGEQGKASPALLQRLNSLISCSAAAERSCCPAQWDRIEAGNAAASAGKAREQLQPVNSCASTTGGFRKTLGMAGKAVRPGSDHYTPLSAVSSSVHHPETSTTLTHHSKSPAKIEPYPP